jgi:hypothetical protein
MFIHLFIFIIITGSPSSQYVSCTIYFDGSAFILTHYFFREIAAARAMLNQYAGIPLGKIKGFRAPFCKNLYSSRNRKNYVLNIIFINSKLHSRYFKRNCCTRIPI